MSSTETKYPCVRLLRASPTVNLAGGQVQKLLQIPPKTAKRVEEKEALRM
jgi:hypothetical protein